MHDILVRVGADTSDYLSGLKTASTTLQAFAFMAVGQMDRVSESFTKGGRDANASFEDIQKGYAEFGARATGVLAGLTSVFATLTIASTIAVGAFVGHAAQFEQAFADVRKTTDATEEQFEQLSRSIREMSLVMPEAATEITRVAATAGQLGVEVENIESFTESMVMLGVAAEDLSAEQAATSLARLMNIMGTNYSDVDRLASTVVDLGNNLATTEGNIVDLAMRLAGAGTQVNMSEADVLSFAGALSSLGLRTEMAGTAFSRVMLNMNTAVMEGGEELALFAQVSGMTVDEFSRAFREDASMAILSFISGLGEMSESGKNTVGVLNDLSLGEIRVRDTLLRTSEASGLLTESLDRGRNAWSENTALQEEYEEKSSTLIARLQILGNHFSYIAQVIGVVLMDAIQPVIGALEWFAEKLVDLAQRLEDAGEGTQKFVGFIILAVPAVFAFITVLLAVATAAAGLYTVFTTLAIALGTTAGTVAVVTAGIIPLIAIIGALAVAVGFAGSKFFEWLKGTDSEVEKLAEETDELTKSTEDLTQSTFDSAAAYGERLAVMEEQQGVTNALVSQLDELAEKENKSMGDKVLLKGLVDDLNQSVDGLSLAYDEQMDSLSMSNEELQARVDLMHEEERGIAAQQRLAEIAQERIDAEMQLEETIRLREIWNEKLEESGFFTAEARGKVMELDEAEKELRQTLETLGTQYEVTEEIVEESSNNMTQIVEENNLAQIQSYEDLSEEQQQTFDRMAENYEALRDAAINAFERINTESSHSLAEMAENMEHNRKATEEWGKNRARLMEWASEEGHAGFIKWLDQTTIDQAGELAEMVSALESSGSEQIGLLEDIAKGYDENATAATEAYRDSLGEGFDEAIDMVVDFVDDKYTTMRSELFDAGFHELGETVPEELESGIDSKAPVVTDRLGILSSDMVSKFDDTPSEFHSIGAFAMGGLKQGIDNNEGAVMSSASRVANRVKETMQAALSIHSPSRDIREEVGRMIGVGLILGMEDMLLEIERTARKIAEYATPIVPNIASLDVGDFEASARGMSANINAEVAHQDGRLVGILSDVRNELRMQSEELRRQKQMIVEMDGRAVGELVEPHVSTIRDHNEIRGMRARGLNISR